MDKPTFLEIHKNRSYKEAIIDSLTGGITEEWMDYYEMTMEYVINEKYHLFDRDDLKGSLYDGEDDVMDLILPSVRRVFGKVFINTPPLFNISSGISEISGLKKDIRLELFQLYYDVDEFIDEFIDQMIKNKNCLHNFKNIDKTSTTLEIIVDNYISGLLKRVLECNDVKTEIRDLKIKKMIND